MEPSVLSHTVWYGVTMLTARPWRARKSAARPAWIRPVPSTTTTRGPATFRARQDVLHGHDARQIRAGHFGSARDRARRHHHRVGPVGEDALRPSPRSRAARSRSSCGAGGRASGPTRRSPGGAARGRRPGPGRRAPRSSRRGSPRGRAGRRPAPPRGPPARRPPPPPGAAPPPARARASSASRPVTGFCEHESVSPRFERPRQPSCMPTHIRMSSRRPSAAFRGIHGSAMRARVIATRSHAPSARRRSAWRGSTTRPA